MAVAQGQFTIVDYNDAVTLTSFISSNSVKTQMYNPDNGSYTPDWTSTNLVLTPSLYVLSTTSDIIATADVTQVKWYIGTSTTAITSAGAYALSGTKSHVLTIKQNTMAGLPGIDYRCEITYKDPTSGLVIVNKSTISFSRVVNGSGITDLVVTTTNGNVFKNKDITSLVAKAELWRGSVVDTTLVTYQWYKMDSSVTVDEGGGSGWKKLTETASKWTGVLSDTLTVFESAVDNVAVFKCLAKDTDPASNTTNTIFIDTATFIDNSDPVQVVITSTGGDKLKNGVGSTTLTALAYRAGTEITTGLTYAWTKYDKNGANPASAGTTKSITVDGSNVDVKATYMVTVTY